MLIIHKILIIAGLFGLTTGMNWVILPLMFVEHGLTSSDIGILMALDTGAVLLMNPLIPYLVRWLGFSRTIMLCTLLRTCGIIALFFCHSFSLWAVVLLTAGLGGAGVFTSVLAILGMAVNKTNRGFYIAFCTVCWALGAALGPLIVNYGVGSSGLLPLLISASSGALGGSIMFFSQAGNYAKFNHSNALGWRQLFVQRPTSFLGGLTSDYVFFSLSSFIVLFVINSGLDQATAALMATAMLVGSILLEIPVGWVSDRVPRIYVSLVSSAVILCMCGLLVLFAATKEIAPFLLAGLCGALAGIYSTSLADLGDHYADGELLSATAGFGFFSSIGAILGPVLTGLAFEIWGPQGMLINISAIVALYAAVVVGAILRRRQHGSGMV